MSWGSATTTQIDLVFADVDSSRPTSNEAVYPGSLVNVVGRSDVEMKTDIDVAGPQLDQPLDRFPLVIDGRARQFEMDAILARLVLRDRLEPPP